MRTNSRWASVFLLGGIFGVACSDPFWKGDGAAASTGGADGSGLGGNGSLGTGAMGPWTAGIGGLGATGGVDSGAGGGPYVPVECVNKSPTLSVLRLSTTVVSALGTPFSTDEQDLNGPTDWGSQYGKTPEIVPFSSGNTLDVLFQDQDSAEFAYVVNVAPSGGSYAAMVAYQVQSLGRIMGLTKDTSGNYYVATGVDEDDVVDASYPPNDVHRPNIVRIVKFDVHGCVLMESDVDMARQAADGGSEIIVNPMTAASSRLVWGGDRLLLVHGHNTKPDPELDGTRHQKAISTQLNAIDGTVARTSTMWVSHSFDQRALYDGSGFVELHLGDAYPRYVALGHYNDGGGDGSYSAFFIKGSSGANNTYTRLGSIVQIEDPIYGYLALFATERTADTEEMVSGTRDVALVRVIKNFVSKNTDESIVEESGTNSLTVTSAGQERTNHVRWLTDLGPESHAERPRLTSLGNGEHIVLYEAWTGGNEYQGTYALRIDSIGNVLAGPTEVVGDHHISRGDDVVTFDGQAVYVTGGAGALHLNLVASDLTSSRVSLP